MDVSAVMTELGHSSPLFFLRLDASTPYVILLTHYVEVNCNSKTVGGFDVRGGLMLYEAANAYYNLANAKQDALIRANCERVTLYSEIPSGITAGEKSLINMYGGLVCVRNQTSKTSLKAIQPSNITFGIVIIDE